MDALATSGVDVTTLANNHAVDYGPLGLKDTLAAVASSPIPVVGIGPNAARAYAPHRFTVRGTGISIFGISQVPDRTFQAWTALERVGDERGHDTCPDRRHRSPGQVIGPMAVEKIDDFEDLRRCADLLPTPAV